MTIESQRVLVEMTKNYNKMTNNMISQCGSLCFKVMETSDLTMSETRCLENCLNKYFKTYYIGEKFSNLITQKINENKDSKRLNTTSDINQSLNQNESVKRNILTNFGLYFKATFLIC